MLWFTIFGLLAFYVVMRLRKSVNYWKDRRVSQYKQFPIIGSILSILSQRISFPERIEEMYKMFPNAKYIGLHQVNMPQLMLRDPELIKQITVKVFDKFMNHRTIFPEELEPVLGRNLLSLKGQKWKNMRSTLSPAFTSSKMRTMYNLIAECAEQFTNYFQKEAKSSNGVVTVEMKDIFTRFANDVIASTAFGLQCDSLQHKDNEFYLAGQKSTDFGFEFLLKMMLCMISPNITKYSGLRLVDRNIARYFIDLILSTVRNREEKGIVRQDMIHLLMQAQKGNLKHEDIDKDVGFATVEESSFGTSQNNEMQLTDEDLVAQAFIFFVAGYKTSTTLMSFMAYELTANPEIQKKLKEEIDIVVNKGTVNYESVLKMKYLDMVVSETLRKWPAAIVLERTCGEAYLIETPNDNEPPLLIEKDLSIIIPTFALHRDPKYFSNPDTFDPERFSDENKHNIVPFTYIPFGAGPRNCIGSRFALLEIKILFVHLLSQFEFVAVERTEIPVKLSSKKMDLTSENGIWLGLKARNYT